MTKATASSRATEATITPRERVITGLVLGVERPFSVREYHRNNRFMFILDTIYTI